MGDESPTPLVMEFIRASVVVITVHQARLHDVLCGLRRRWRRRLLPRAELDATMGGELVAPSTAAIFYSLYHLS